MSSNSSPAPNASPSSHNTPAAEHPSIPSVASLSLHGNDDQGMDVDPSVTTSACTLMLLPLCLPCQRLLMKKPSASKHSNVNVYYKNNTIVFNYRVFTWILNAQKLFLKRNKQLSNNNAPPLTTL